jgi:lipopolysaccharide transport system ATP-binding protein
LEPLTAEVPAGAVVGLTGDDTAAQDVVLALASGELQPQSGAVDAERGLVLGHAFSRAGLFERARLRWQVETARRAGSAVLLASQDEALLESLCDEVWWMDEGRLACQAQPREALAACQRTAMRRIADWGRATGQPLEPSLRRGDGRAKLLAVETLNAEDRPSAVWQSGSAAGVLVRLRYEAAVENPVVGIMIRTRIGFEVFGTNTELERISLGSPAAGDELNVIFRFPCGLCPQEYTITAASHDSDGTWHDWIEDAVLVSVTDTRYTAGVANLRATVEIRR